MKICPAEGRFMKTCLVIPSSTFQKKMIPAHHWVVLIREDGTQGLIRASRNAEVRAGNRRALGDQLVGHPYGSTFEFQQLETEDDQTKALNEKRAQKRKTLIHYSKLVRVQPTRDAFAILKSDSQEEEVTGADDEEEDDRDNRDYHADPKNQQANSIELRKSGATDHEIVRALTANSLTFEKKNKLSQAKYLRRLQLKHVPRVTVVRATTRTVAEVLFNRHSSSLASDAIRACRWVDSLPQILAYGNIHASSRCLVLDGIGGLLSLAVLERLQENGRCMFVGTNPKECQHGGGRPFISFLNLPKQVLINRFIVLPSYRFNNGAILPATHVVIEESSQKRRQQQQDDSSIIKMEDVVDEEEVANEEEEEEEAGDDNKKKRVKAVNKEDQDDDFIANQEIRRKMVEESLVLLDISNGGKGADSLIIAARQDPWEALQVLLPHLGLGKPFVVHHPCIEPLMRARAKLAESKSVLDLIVTESFCREYQVLPNRTHPHMTGNATGGFILRGIKVMPWREEAGN